ncbi:ribonuclease H-like domain-containing protein [Tanacetum coccineum]
MQNFSSQQFTWAAPQPIYQLAVPAQQLLYSVVGPHAHLTAQQGSPIYVPGNYAHMTNAFRSQATMLPQTLHTMTAQDPSWNMNTGASSHLRNNNLIQAIIHPYLLAMNLISVRKFTRDNDVSVEFDAYGFSVRDYQTRRILLRCDSTGDLYPVTQQSSSQTPVVLLSFSSTTWHRRLGHPGDDVLRRLESRNLISCRKSKLSALCHACQLGKHAKLPFNNSESSVHSVFEIIHSDIWTSPIPSESGIKYYAIFLDHFSHFVWVYPLHKKSDLFDNFVAFRAYVNKQFNVDIKAFTVCHDGSDIAYLLLYANDIILIASSSAFLQRIIASLHSEFAMTDLGSLNYFLGISAHDRPYSDGDLVSDLLYIAALLHILHYVRGTLDYCLQLHISSTTQLTAYTDADWVGCPVTRRSTSGYGMFLGDNILSWSAKHQVTLSRSSAEAEYRGIANVVAQTVWILYMSANPVQYQRTKHIKIDIHLVRDFVAKGEIRVLPWCPSRFNMRIFLQSTYATALFIEFSS